MTTPVPEAGQKQSYRRRNVGDVGGDNSGVTLAGLSEQGLRDRGGEALMSSDPSRHTGLARP